MCYDVKFLTQKKIKYAKRKGASPEEVKELEEKLIKLTGGKEPQFCVSGFKHPQLLVFIDPQNNDPHLFSWGLIPDWIRNREDASEIQNKTLNARVESIFEKPSFRGSAGKKHCLIMVDGFYEHYHYKNLAYPYYIFHPNEEPMVFAGLWSEWQGEDGNPFFSASIVTTKAKGIMSKIHNNPRLKESRMPLILSQKNEQDWLRNVNRKEDVDDFVSENPYFDLRAHPVCFIRGKKSLGNVSKASDRYFYPELNLNTLF